MRKNIHLTSINLPSIVKTNPSNSNAFKNSTPQNKLDQNKENQTQKDQIIELEKWSTRNYQGYKSKGSKLVSSFVRNASQKNKKRMTLQSAITMDAKLYIIRLQNQLKKAYQINYGSVYKNLEYCSGIYQNFYGGILKYIKKIYDTLTQRYTSLQNFIQSQRKKHIQCLQGQNKQEYFNKIPLVRQEIQRKQQQLQPIKNAIDSIQNARIRVLQHALLNGYDVRQQGLIWILKQLKYVPRQGFPPFLNQRQINYIINKFQKDNQKEEQRKIDNIIEQDIRNAGISGPSQMSIILMRRRKRQLSIIKEGEYMQKLKLLHKQKFSTERHKYIDQQILKMAEDQFPKTKSTKYQIIYKQTVKKLNRFCISQIYKKSNNKKQKDTNENRRQSFNTLKILSHLDAKIQQYMRSKSKQQPFLNSEQKELDQIIRSLRSQAYQQNAIKQKNDRYIRNPVSIIGCLVGWRKAKKIIQQQMSYLL